MVATGVKLICIGKFGVGLSVEVQAVMAYNESGVRLCPGSGSVLDLSYTGRG